MARIKTAAPPEPTWAELKQEILSYIARCRAENEGRDLGRRLGEATQAQRDLVWQILDGAVPSSEPAQIEGRLH